MKVEKKKRFRSAKRPMFYGKKLDEFSSKLDGSNAKTFSVIMEYLLGEEEAQLYLKKRIPSRKFPVRKTPAQEV